MPITHSRRGLWCFRVFLWCFRLGSPEMVALCELLPCCFISMVCVWQQYCVICKGQAFFLHSSLTSCSFLVQPQVQDSRYLLSDQFKTNRNTRRIEESHCCLPMEHGKVDLALLQGSLLYPCLTTWFIVNVCYNIPTQIKPAFKHFI